MQIEIRHRPSYALAIVHLDAGETVVAEAGAMVTQDTHVELSSSSRGSGQSKGGLLAGLKRLVAGESFILNRFTAQGAPGHLTLAPIFPGDLVVHELAGTGLILQSSAYLCSDDTVAVDASWGGARTFFGGEGLIMLKATGHGPIVFNTFGGLEVVDVDGAYTVDTGHIVAFEDTLQFDVGRFGGSWSSLLLSGEGLVCNFRGHGRLWIQTRNPQEFGTLVGPRLPARER